MPKEHPRTRRIADQIQRELSDIIRLELKDPRVRMVTITDVEVLPDYTRAKVFFTSLGTPEEARTSLEGLNRAAGFLRSALFHRMALRVIPQLHFVYDTSIERGVRLTHLIDEAVASGPSGEKDGEPKP